MRNSVSDVNRGSFKIRIYDRAEMLQMYLDWFNNFLTIERFANYYGITEEQAEEIINTGRETLERQHGDGKVVKVRHDG